jgi:Domain of unknown function (DUF4405)
MNTPEAAPSGKKSSPIRKWVTPLTMGTFLLTVGTGLGLFFEVNWGFVKPIHEWLSLAFVAGGALHAVDHWKGISKHWSGWWGKSFVIAFALILGFSFLPLGKKEPWPSMQKMTDALGNASVQEVAKLAGVPTDSVTIRLARAGFAGATPATTILTACGGTKDGLRKGLASVFMYP